MGTLSVDKLVKTSAGAAEFTLPATDGTAGQVWQTDGSGQLSVATVGSSGIATDAVTATEIAAGAVGTSEIAALAVTASEIAATTITPAQMANSAFLANRNMVVNGAMQIAQRGTSQSAMGTGYNTVDRWYTTKANSGTWTQTQEASTIGTSGFYYSLKNDCTTALASLAAGDRLMMSYRFEGLNCQNLKKGTADAESVTISFWVNATKTGTYILEFFDHPNSRHICKAYTVSTTDTWEYKTITFAGDTTGSLSSITTTKALELQWYMAAGTNYTSGTLATSWAANTSANRAVGQVNAADSTSNNFYLAGVQMEVGITATPFEHQSFGQELAACQRYYNKTFAYATAPANGAGHTWSGAFLWDTRVTTLSPSVNWQYPVAMRALPTVTLYNTRTGGTAGQWTTGGSDGANARALSTSETTASIDNTGTTLGAASWGIHATAESEL